jgi:hypothetical protein
MRNAPPGTGSWFGWANAVISDLTPTAAGIEIRRRKRHHQPVAYPMTVLIAAAILSLAAQVAEARPTLAGWISSAVPALAFLALTKLVLGRTMITPNGELPCATVTTPNATSAPTAENTTPTPTAAPAATTPMPDDFRDLRPVPSGQLLISARMTAFNHQQATGQPITAGELADRLAVPPALAGALLDHLGGTPPPVTAVNGTPVHAEGRP